MEVGGDDFGDIVTGQIAIILSKGEAFAGVGGATENATSDGPGEVDGRVLLFCAGALEHVDGLCNIAETLAFIEREIDGDSEERVRHGFIAHESDVGHFSNTFVELLIVGFGQQINERFEGRAADDSAQECARVFGATDVTFDFMSDQGSHGTCAFCASVGDDEPRFAIFGFITGIDGLDQWIKDALPSGAESVVIQDSIESVTDFGCFEAAIFEFVLLGVVETRLTVAIVGRGVFECIVTAHDEAGTGPAISSSDSALRAQVFCLQDASGNFSSQHGAAGAIFQELKNGTVDFVLANAVISNLLPVAVDAIAKHGDAFQFFAIVPKIGIREVTGASAGFPIFLDIGQVGRVTDSDGIHRHSGE